VRRVRSSLRKHLRNQKSDRKRLLPGVWAAGRLVSRGHREISFVRDDPGHSAGLRQKAGALVRREGVHQSRRSLRWQSAAAPASAAARSTPPSLRRRANRKPLAVWTHMHIQLILRHIHLHPSLRNRAYYAALATVRVRWNDGRGSPLRSGLQSPWMKRSPVRHRISHCSRCSDS
jgi:hypothetical protein